ncbi:MAG TPA: rRNA methyltransferase [Bacteroidales bacterium]|nr:rRNA methyltransferase [Bacteroidales bacterium]
MSLTVTTHISSKQNPGIKNLVLLQKQKERAEQNLILIEGLKEIEKADLSGYVIEQVYFCPEIIGLQQVSELFTKSKPGKVFSVSADVFEKIAYRESTGGVIVLAKPKLHTFSGLNLPKNPLLLVLEGVEKPGNMGAIYRTADAAGIDAVLIAEPRTDLYNPNAIRASLGCVFSVPTVICSGAEALNWLKTNQIHIFSTYLQAAVPYHTVNFAQPCAIVLGTEADGISDQWVKNSNTNIIIPMRGQADSMNVSTAAAVVVFEACRQRGFK